jgi:prephenate dehydratase
MLTIHTLGPSGTNCERAANEYLSRIKRDGNVRLHSTLENAVVEMMKSGDESLLLGCVVYPKLHEIVFQNLMRLKMTECFVIDTYEMVFASNKERLEDVTSVCTHPAPEHLVGLVPGLAPRQVVQCNSNAEASRLCAESIHDGCITTSVAARNNRLVIHKNFGPVPMGFTIHRKEACA